MNDINLFEELLAQVPPELKKEVDFEFAVSDRINGLMEQRGLSKAQLARELGKRPCEVTQWLSGQHNFTLKTLAQLSSFFGVDIISV